MWGIQTHHENLDKQKKKVISLQFFIILFPKKEGGEGQLHALYIHYLHVKIKKIFEEGQFNGKYRSKLIPKSCQ